MSVPTNQLVVFSPIQVQLRMAQAEKPLAHGMTFQAPLRSVCGLRISSMESELTVEDIACEFVYGTHRNSTGWKAKVSS